MKKALFFNTNKNYLKLVVLTCVIFSNLSTHFVCFHELQGFHKETDLMTMTISGMCTGEVIKHMTR